MKLVELSKQSILFELISKLLDKSVGHTSNTIIQVIGTINDIYIIDSRYVLKQYFNRFIPGSMHYTKNVESILYLIQKLNGKMNIPKLAYPKLISLNKNTGLLFHYVHDNDETPSIPSMIARYHKILSTIRIPTSKQPLRHLHEIFKTNIEIAPLYDMNPEPLQNVYDILPSEEIVLHGDFKTDAFIGKTLIDFDNIIMGPRIFDLAQYIFYQHDTYDTENNEAMTASAIAEYDKEYSLTSDEIRLIRPLINAVQVIKNIDALRGNNR
jgi:thiamine kinase-like enzyme